jgi:hypothetical protein
MFVVLSFSISHLTLYKQYELDSSAFRLAAPAYWKLDATSLQLDMQ